MPYSPSELKLLETSLLNWLKSMGVLSKFYGNKAQNINSLIEVQKELTNGTLLAEIISVLFNVKIHGIFKDPKTESTAL